MESGDCGGGVVGSWVLMGRGGSWFSNGDGARKGKRAVEDDVGGRD